MSVKTEVKSLHRIRERAPANGKIAGYIYSFKPGQLVLDFYFRNWVYAGDIPEWDEGERYRQLVTLPFTNYEGFRQAYRIARIFIALPRHIRVVQVV
ncbi:hypothetical protein VH79_14515 [Salmonella enterica]|uniref:Uncharacterized protein n=1 Tax=Salmonella enterica TaxID=28901 RepID=A0A5U3IT60_SALER|nr:hypothetical protein [Salmonella enterica]